MTKAQLKTAKAKLAKLEAQIAAAGGAVGSFSITENKVNTEKFGDRYVYVELQRADLEARKALKAISYGAKGRGKARWDNDLGLWSIKASALKGSMFASSL